MPRLFAESFAPWCEKARWALDHHRVKYDYTEHLPMLGELVLRIAAKRPGGIVTVPLLVDDEIALMDSLEIARWAERVGRGDPLFPTDDARALDSWNATSERIMKSGRAMLLQRMKKNPDALAEQLPPFIPSALRAPLRPLASAGVTHLMRKYNVRDDGVEEHERESRDALDALRQALAGGRRYLVGDAFSFADVTMATSLQFVLPVADRYIALGAATRAAWTQPNLAAEYADLLAWRDALYETHRAS